ncbi:FecR domain-containing protein [Chitinophaga sp.]|uniref:FecR family protein n=1 Tax=Chitinophaga sp. TaxID=1869181 RepID=UPI0031D14C59
MYSTYKRAIPMSKENIQELAEKWLNGTATPAEIQRLQEWYHDRESMPTPVPDAEMAARIRAGIHIGRKRQSLKWVSVAAAVLLLIVGGYHYFARVDVKRVVVYVPREHQNRLLLPDSSEVWLNADSKLTYNETDHKREVTLEGEAFFNIKQAVGRPFVVKAGPCTATVLGTSFNIKAYKNDPKVLITVATGKVQVQDQHQQLKVLTANKQIALEPITGAIREKQVNAVVYKAWIDGSFEVNNETFEEVANRLSRKYDVDIHFDNPALAHCTFLASFDQAANLPFILSMLCKINNSTFSISEDKREVTISGSGCSN